MAVSLVVRGHKPGHSQIWHLAECIPESAFQVNTAYSAFGMVQRVLEGRFPNLCTSKAGRRFLIDLPFNREPRRRFRGRAVRRLEPCDTADFEVATSARFPAPQSVTC